MFIGVLCVVLSLAYHATGSPTLAYPFNSQVPPVARVGQLYNYTLPSNTFANYGSSIIYSLTGNPSWLSINSVDRRLYGTPSASDVGSPSFNLVATDSSGSATDPIVLVVSQESGPYIAISLESQLQAMGQVDSNGGLILASGTPFTVIFSKNTFAETGANVSAYYGTSDNYTPLPSWISFDPSDVKFTGTSPSLETASPQYFDFVLVGTDYPGFAGISATFRLVIQSHSLAFAPDSYSVDATVGVAFQFKLPISNLKLDGLSIGQSNISAAYANTTGSWLAFDNSSYIVSGKPTSSDRSTTVSLSFEDLYGDIATATVIVDLNTTSTTNKTDTTNSTSASIISNSLPLDFNVTEGTFFTYTFNQSDISSSATVNVTITGASWLHYNPANRTLYGEVPTTSATKSKRQSAGGSSVTITATENGQTQTQTVGVTVSSASSTTSSITTSASSKPSSTSTATETVANIPSAHHGLDKSQKLGIGLGIAAFLLVVILAGVLVICCRKKTAGTKKSTSSEDISRPLDREKEEWPSRNPAADVYGEPRQLGAFGMFKSTSDGRLSGYAVELNDSGSLAPPLASLELPPLPESPGFDAVRSAYGTDETRSTSSSVRAFSPAQARDQALSVNNSVGNIQASQRDSNTIKSIVYPRRSALRGQDQRDSTNTLDTVSTDELFSVRLVGQDSQNAVIDPPLNISTAPTRIANAPTTTERAFLRQPVSMTGNQDSLQTLGTYSSSEGDYIQRFGSQGESLSSDAHSRSISQKSRNNSNQPQPWRVIQSQDSYDSFGSYATTDSDLSDEFSFDESLSGQSNERPVYGQHGIVEESEDEEVSEIAQATSSSLPVGRPKSDPVLLEAPLSPDWATYSRQSSIARRPTLNERVTSFGKGNLREFTAARRPMSSASIDQTADTTGSSAELAFV